MIKNVLRKRGNLNQKNDKEINLMTGGVVKWFNEKKGYGFIENDEDGDVFVHHSDITGIGFKSLVDGDRLAVTIETHRLPLNSG
jgi:CspA family cold shock protein